MNLNDWLVRETKQLKKTGVSTARLDLLVLLADELKKDKSYLLAHPDIILQGPSLQTLDKQVRRRAKHEPLAYIRGKSEFYGREFLVTPDTLEPRPETETMISLLKKLISTPEKVRPLHVLDIGTGSGCLGITAKLELPVVTVLATDISDACIVIARNNAKNLKAEVKFYKGNLLEALPASISNLKSSDKVVLANLPYVPDEHTINKAAMFEPRLAIFGGPDGLDCYRKLFLQIANISQFDSRQPRCIFTESLPFQHAKLTQIAKAAGYKLETSDDFVQVFSAT